VDCVPGTGKRQALLHTPLKFHNIIGTISPRSTVQVYPGYDDLLFTMQAINGAENCKFFFRREVKVERR